MRAIPLFAIARRHLTHNLFRTSISVGGVALGISFMVAMGAMMSGFQRDFVEDAIESNAHVTIYDEPRAGTDDFASWAARAADGVVTVESARPRERIPRIKKPLQILDVIRRTEGVVAAAPNVVGSAVFTYGGREVPSSVVGIEPESQERVTPIDKDLVSGRAMDLYSAGGAVILGHGLAKKLGVERGDTVTAVLRTGQVRPLRVVGLLRTGLVTIDDARAYMLISLAQQLLGLGRDVNRIVLRTDDPAKADLVAARIEPVIGYKTESWQEANADFLSIFVVQKVITYVITFGIMIVAAFGILNVLIMLVLEKFPEIAMLKSMGYTARDVTLTFLMEGLGIGLLGVVVGCTLGYHLTELLGSIPLQQRGLIEAEHLLMNNVPELYVRSSAVALLCTAVAAFVPAWRAGRLDPVAILRGHA